MTSKAIEKGIGYYISELGLKINPNKFLTITDYIEDAKKNDSLESEPTKHLIKTLEIVEKETINEIDRKITELENKRGLPKQDPDSNCKLIELKGIPYYPAKVIDKIDSEIWTEWRKFIENKKKGKNIL